MKSQTSFLKSTGVHALSHGGSLRNQRKGRGQRPLSCKESLHIVFKLDRRRLRSKSLRAHKPFALSQAILKRYAKKFFIKIEQVSIQGDHIHALVRTSQRSFFHHFFRVTSGQIAQQFQKQGLLVSATYKKSVTDTPGKSATKRKKLWIYRPFSRVVKGFKAYKIVRNYIQLNEQEARGIIKYSKLRLRGLSNEEWEILWSDC